MMLLKEKAAHKAIVGFKKTGSSFSLRRNKSYNIKTAFGLK
jgi:hypothetical protein